MKYRFSICIVVLCLSTVVYCQDTVFNNLALLFRDQLTIFPQEKLYLHTDKPYYISGEKVWFRAYLTDAVTHIPTPVSRYVYVELIDPLDSVVTRVKINQDRDAYYGHLAIPNDVPEGDYTLRAYTAYMLNQDENYLYTKSIRIIDPQARAIHTESRFFFETEERLYATFIFSQTGTSTPVVPLSVKVALNDGKPMTITADADGKTTVYFDIPPSLRQRVIFLELSTDGNLYRQFVRVPAPDNDFEVSFYPEGGALMLGTACRVAFKAIKSNGQAIDVSGTVYDYHDNEVGQFKSDYLGMGSFHLLAQRGERYYAVCKNDKGESKRFDLPVALEHGYALSVNHVRGNLYISVQKPSEDTHTSQTTESTPAEELYLLAHTRGMIQLIEPWDNEENMVIIPKDLFPSGVLHLILFDSNLNPVSERLTFVNNPDQAQVAYSSDKGSYERRSLVKSSVTLTDYEGIPLSGSFSVSVTSDREVEPDTTTSILTQLLLTSDLHGYIENPAYYFQNSTSSAWALDLLMLTQGWRRYDIAKMTQGSPLKPALSVEFGSEISGTVRNLIFGRVLEDALVTVISLSLENGYFNSTRTDREGRFFLSTGDLPDSTRFMVSVEPVRGLTRLGLVLDEETFPERRLSVVPPAEIDRRMIAQYADKAEQQYVDEYGIRTIAIPELGITAQRTPPRRFAYYTNPNNTISEEDIRRVHPTNIVHLLQLVPGVVAREADSPGASPSIVIRGITTINGDSPSASPPGRNSYDPPTETEPPPLILLNDIPVDIGILNLISINDIAQIDVLKGANAAIFGSRGSLGVISIYTKEGGAEYIATESFHIKTVMPLGYQQPVEFYAPKYDTPAERDNRRLDLRTTIHWQPVVQTNSRGVASFEFYTADEQTSYTVTIEGVTDNGAVVRREERLWQRD